MRNKFLAYFLFSILPSNANRQPNDVGISELKTKLLSAKNDSTRSDLAIKLASGYRFSNIDSSFFYNDLGLKLATKLNWPAMKAALLSLKAATLLESGKLPESLRLQFEALNPTGLGLSLAYDIITKEYNGTIKAESKEGEGSELIISL